MIKNKVLTGALALLLCSSGSLAWASPADEPYMVSATRGHEMINDFIGFYNKPSTIFADGVSDYAKLPAPTIGRL